jgi:hypothetical protein
LPPNAKELLRAKLISCFIGVDTKLHSVFTLFDILLFGGITLSIIALHVMIASSAPAAPNV